ncbi:hypothetical protein L1987_80737 [Smallanthus sonchifolius]|uniref:Uncharacterized protein n=1 Tax=Smallanthus sonchifolius TaxID=185202 RepID=A0ACB8YNH7_9ASTR|nr:hypothetical protein L1987_80737 [Smallanthus sonchifolius]
MAIFYLKKGIHQEFSASYTPQQTGVVERKNRTLIDTARTMLSDAKLTITFWEKTINTACHVLNRVLVVKRHNKTSYELINNRPPKLDYLIPFGYVANSPCKRVYNIESHTVEEWFEVDYSKYITPPELAGPAWGFDYDNLFKSFNIPDLSADDASNLYQYFSGGDNSNFSTTTTIPIPSPSSNAASTSGTYESDTEEDTHNKEDGAQVRNEVPVEPINNESSSETRIHRNHPIHNIIDDPNVGVQTHHKTVTENTSLYAEILNTGVMETCLKVAFVSQIEHKNIKEALADNCWIEAMQDELSQFRKLHCMKNVTQPPGFEDPLHPDKVYKLDKALYGLHQAPRSWSTNEEMCKEFEQVMKYKFEMSNMGDMPFFLGLQVSQREDGIYLHQTKYVQDILSKYKMNDCTSYGTPIPVNHSLHPDKDGKDVDCKLYHGIIGSLMYLTTSRPDIMFSVCLCSRFQSQPKEYHMIAVKRIFRYLKGKYRLGLWYSKQQSFEFTTYTDSDYGGCNLYRKSTSVHTDDNFADLLTKAFDCNLFEHPVNMIGMFNPE